MQVNKRIALGAAAAAVVGITVPVLADPGRPAGGTGTAYCFDSNGNQMDGTITYSPTTIWPPNHKFQTITVNYSETDNDGDTLTVAAPSATHNQMTNGVEDVGAGNTPVDFTPGAPGSATDPGPATTRPQVRSERSGKDGDRVYSITVTCSDSGGADVNDPSETTGQMGTATITVTVPHDQRKQ